MNRGVYIASAVRTPIGKFGGGLADFSAADLGVIVVREALRRAFGSVPAERTPGDRKRMDSAAPPRVVDELILGNARPAGVGPNLARQVAWRAGLGDDVPAFSVNMACASGIRAILLGWQQITLGSADVIVAGGTESMSRVPYLVDARWGMRMGHQPLVDAMYRDGFLCPISQMIMGETAELLAQEYRIPRAEQDEFALESHRRAARAMESCRFREEIVAVEKTDAKGRATRIDKDEHVRPDVTLEGLAKLPAVFAKDGTITAGNASGITDAASVVVLVSEERLKTLAGPSLARIVDATVAAVEPHRMGIAPVPACRKLDQQTGWKIRDYTTVELNEAFAAQVLACDRELEFDRTRLNPNGGAISLGHPIGATGARIVTTLLHELRRQPQGTRRGLATLCVSGGLGVALALEAA
jgi:acetyl-CoA C-acetyltransferase